MNVTIIASVMVGKSSKNIFASFSWISHESLRKLEINLIIVYYRPDVKLKWYTPIL